MRYLIDSLHENVEKKNECDFYKEDKSKKGEFSKKYEKCKYDIDLQAYKVCELKNEVAMRKKNFFPPECIEIKELELANETKKFECMIQKTIELQSILKDNFGKITTDLNDEAHKYPPETPSGISKLSGVDGCDIIDAYINEYEQLEEDRYHLQECVLTKEQNLSDVENQVQMLNEQMTSLIKENQMLTEKLKESEKSSDDADKLRTILNNSKALSANIQRMEDYLKRLREEFEASKNSNDNELMKRARASGDCGKKVQELECKYKNLLQKYCSKNEECNNLTTRLQNTLKTIENSTEQAENETLKEEAQRLMTEIVDYKTMIHELQFQINLYRDKFMKAQEKVEEQKLKLETLTATNKKIESQVNSEISKIKDKFQHKLSELCPYPKMYEESRVQLEASKDKIETLQADLKATIDALCKAKCELKNLKSQQPDESIKAKYDKLQCEMENVKRKYCNLSETKKCLEEKLVKLKEELEQLRSDSVKVITTTKCCAEKNRQVLHEQINCLEQKLAECNAKSSVSLGEKEEVIRKLKQELTLLCGHFNNCQDQIKSLKCQIEYLQDQRYKTNSNANECCDF